MGTCVGAQPRCVLASTNHAATCCQLTAASCPLNGAPFAFICDGMTPPLAPAADLRALDNVTARAESMNALATLLLDWRVDCERHLRTLTCIQRWLERVRCGAAGAGECELLLQEMGRLLREAPPKHDDWTHQAETHLNNIAR